MLERLKRGTCIHFRIDAFFKADIVSSAYDERTIIYIASYWVRYDWDMVFIMRIAGRFLTKIRGIRASLLLNTLNRHLCDTSTFYMFCQRCVSWRVF